MHYHKEAGPGTGTWDQSQVAVKFYPRDAGMIRVMRAANEMGKKTDSYADHQRKMLFDPLDQTGVIFYAESNSQLLGTLRVKF